VAILGVQERVLAFSPAGLVVKLRLDVVLIDIRLLAAARTTLVTEAVVVRRGLGG
jgi:hypothetical protein